MNTGSHPPEGSDSIAAHASAWLARRDRGLSAAEQDEFLQWLREDARHRAALTRLERTWGALDTLSQWQPAHSARPNPDLLAPPQRSSCRRSWRVILGGAGLAAAALWILAWSLPGTTNHEPAEVAQGLRVIPAPERQMLEDGSILELKRGSGFSLVFTTAERRVRLLQGEFHVTVAKNAARPFIVDVDGLAVRAVGTAFNVRRGAAAIEVLVTEGTVQLESPPARKKSAPDDRRAVPVRAGERARVVSKEPLALPIVETVSATEMERELAWQSARLEFEELPLAAVVAEFNLRNRQQLVIGDPSIASLRVAGTFRADRVEAFARLLEATFGIKVDRGQEGAWELRRAE